MLIYILWFYKHIDCGYWLFFMSSSSPTKTNITITEKKQNNDKYKFLKNRMDNGYDIIIGINELCFEDIDILYDIYFNKKGLPVNFSELCIKTQYRVMNYIIMNNYLYGVRYCYDISGPQKYLFDEVEKNKDNSLLSVNYSIIISRNFNVSDITKVLALGCYEILNYINKHTEQISNKNFYNIPTFDLYDKIYEAVVKNDLFIHSEVLVFMRAYIKLLRKDYFADCSMDLMRIVNRIEEIEKMAKNISNGAIILVYIFYYRKNYKAAFKKIEQAKKEKHNFDRVDYIILTDIYSNLNRIDDIFVLIADNKNGVIEYIINEITINSKDDYKYSVMDQNLTHIVKTGSILYKLVKQYAKINKLKEYETTIHNIILDHDKTLREIDRIERTEIDIANKSRISKEEKEKMSLSMYNYIIKMEKLVKKSKKSFKHLSGLIFRNNKVDCLLNIRLFDVQGTHYPVVENFIFYRSTHLTRMVNSNVYRLCLQEMAKKYLNMRNIEKTSMLNKLNNTYICKDISEMIVKYYDSYTS